MPTSGMGTLPLIIRVTHEERLALIMKPFPRIEVHRSGLAHAGTVKGGHYFTRDKGTLYNTWLWDEEATRRSPEGNDDD